MAKKKNEHVIKEVYPGSIAEEMEIEPGDVLLSINNEEIGDVFDYRYLIKDEYVEALIRKPDGEEWLLEIDKEYGALGKFAAAGYRDARQNFKWMHDMQRMTELEDFYDYTREPEKKQKYREELTALLEEKVRMSHNKAQRLQMMFRLAQIEFKEEEYDRAARLLEEIAREGNTLGVAGQAQQMLSRLYR